MVAAQCIVVAFTGAVASIAAAPSIAVVERE
jgi:hypothetical protein